MLNNTKTRRFLTSLVAASSLFAISSCEKDTEELVPTQKSVSEAALDPQCRCVMYTNFTITGTLSQGSVIKLNYENGSSYGDKVELVSSTDGKRYRLNDNIQQVGASVYEVYCLIPKYVPDGSYSLLVSDVNDPTRNNGGRPISFTGSNANYAEGTDGLVTYPQLGGIIPQKYQRSAGSARISWNSRLVNASEVRITVFPGTGVHAQTFAIGSIYYANAPGASPLTAGVTSTFPNNGSVNLPMSLFPVNGTYSAVIEGITQPNNYGFTDPFVIEGGEPADM